MPAFERAFGIYGVCVAVGSNDRDVFERLVDLLPAGTAEGDPADAARFSVLSSGPDAWRFVGPDQSSGTFVDVELTIALLDSALRQHVVEHAPDKVFLHAGAVAHRGRAILVPGRSFSGKSTLVAALVRAGAEYYSDEHAVLDEHGLVHPYARPLAIRQDDPLDVPLRRSAASMGGSTGAAPIPVGLVAATAYRPDKQFAPERRSPGQGMLLLMQHIGRSDAKSQAVLTAVRHAVADAQVVEGPRGDADTTARILLELADASSTNGTAGTR